MSEASTPTVLAELEGLRAQLALRDAALNAATTHFIIVDAVQPDLPIVYANRAMAQEHGFSTDELIGKSVNVLATSEMDPPRESQFRPALEGRTVRSEMRVLRKDGSAFWLGYQSVPLRNADGVITHVVSVGADITARLEMDRKKRELQEQLLGEMRERERMAIELRLAQKLEAVGRLASGIAHEMNTPIQYVGDSIQFLRTASEDVSRLVAGYQRVFAGLGPDGPPEAMASELAELELDCDLEFIKVEVPRAFDRTMEGVERVTGIVRAMKEFAHPDGTEHASADLNRALNTTLTVARGEYKYAATVVTDLGDLPLVLCNVGELNQVFLNLIVNAAHAIHDSGKAADDGRITVSTRAIGDDAVEVTIGDNGCGIAQEHVDKIFDPFFTTKEVGRGTGQGLAIVRSIVVDKHRGNISVTSQVGVGTQFTVRVPIRAEV